MSALLGAALALSMPQLPPDGPEIPVAWEAQPRQALLISCPIEDALFGGARGGGKTDGILGDWASHQDLYGKHAKGILFRKTYDELEEVIARSKEIYPALGGKWKEGKRTWFFPNGARLKMRYLDKDEDADRYQGHSYTWIAFEELTNWADPTPIDKMRATLRSGNSPVPTFFRATANPGGLGHNWVKKRYIDAAPPMTPFVYIDPDTKARTERVFIPSKLSDNLALMKNDPHYRDKVAASAGGNKALLEAWMNGNWDIVAGGMFDDVFRRGKHSIEPFDIPSSWRVDRSYDHGEARPFSVGWWAESDGTEAPNGRVYPAGTLFRIWEWYGCTEKPNTGLGLTSREIARGIKEMEQTVPILQGLDIQPGPADTAIFAAEDGVSIADKMEEEGIEWTRADKRPGSRKTGWSNLRELLQNSLKSPMEFPGLFVFNTCTDWMRTVPTLPRDKKNMDDVDTKAEDHAGDETRYRVQAPPVPQIEEPQGSTGRY